MSVYRTGGRCYLIHPNFERTTAISSAIKTNKIIRRQVLIYPDPSGDTVCNQKASLGHAVSDGVF
jgi:hypothetical protein